MKKLLTALLLVAMLLSVFVACKDKDKNNADNTTDAPSTPVTDEISREMTDDLPADLKFEGEEFLIGTYHGGNISQGWACYFDCDEPEAGNILEEAAYDRNEEIRNRLGVEISVTEDWLWDGTGNGIVYVMGTLSVAGQGLYDNVFMESFHSYDAFIIDELVKDVAAMPYIDLDKGYYNQSANNVYYLRDNLYFFVSDTTYACQNASMIVVNNDMLKDLGYAENYLYDMVNNGTWTIEVIFDMIEGVASDLDGNGVADTYMDKWGFSGQPYAPCYLYPGAGLKGTYLTDDGFAFDYGTDYSYEVMNRILDLVEHPDVYLDYGENWAHSFDAFFAGNSLFLGYASEIRQLQQIDTFEFGILPYPKFKETQDTYATLASGGAMIIPANINNEDMVGAVVEAMACGSAKHFVPAFYENFIEQGVICDEPSRENWAKMLGEWGAYEFTRWIKPDDRLGGFGPAFRVIGEASRDFQSSWDEQKGTIEQICDEFYEYYLAP